MRGFTLIEVTLVLLIVGILAGSLLVPLQAQIERHKRDQTLTQLREIERALLGFAAANRRLPCPASATSSGREDPIGGGDCSLANALQVAHGFVPVATLGLVGPINDDGLLLDAWHNPVRYSVTQAASDTAADFTTADGLRTAGISQVEPNLVVCVSSDLCSAQSDVVRANRLPAVVFSMGRDWANYRNADQLENAGERLDGDVVGVVLIGSSGVSYPMPEDSYFVSKPYQVTAEQPFDDMLLWVSANLLYTHLIWAGVLP